MRGKVARRLTLAGLAVGMSAQAQPKRFLVQFKESSSFDALARRGTRKAAARDDDEAITVTRALKHVRVLVVTSERGPADLARLPGVVRVEEEVMHRPPVAVATWGRAEVSRGISPDQVARPWGIDAVRAPAAWEVSRGDGARVMVLDTGVDQDHPSLRSRFEKGLNFTTSDAADFADREGHGTHVAATILGDGRRGGVVGVAPRARLLAGKVCAKEGCSSAAIAAGLDWAIAEGVDVVNMSLSGDTLTGIEAAALARAERAGLVIAAASGNDGVGYVGYPAAVPTVLAVGAVAEDGRIADFSQWGDELAVVGPGVDVLSAVPRGTGRASEVTVANRVLRSQAAQGTPAAAITGEVVAVGLGQASDYENVDVRGRVVLIKRGKIKFTEKMKHAVERGARAALFYNNEVGLMRPTLAEEGRETAIPAAMIERAAGEELNARLVANERVELELTVHATDYAELQGTSMATPHVAGVLALVRAVNRDLSAAESRQLIRETATPIEPNPKNKFGRGLVNAEAAVRRAIAPVPIVEELRQVVN